MNNRWKMNRIGFVNFWLYDDEVIDLADGKLLLRGQNGSGKSITTQSFIPFILDGDRTPSRLDPFGSSDRRMEYYFLGEEGREEATGYLFLEFKKEKTQEYRTIAIGQRARRGKAMDFWGFVILDGRRIGHDLWLYKETGSTRLPYSKQEMKKVLGDETPFTDVPGEYKALVNKYIFGFSRPEQYEQFIRLLVKVRAPKLSKEFKPTKVYDILNESLQTLTDEDLRAMVDAMEKMDGIQENLEQLNRSFGDVKIIRTEYIRYNQFMLARKARTYMERRQEVEKEQQRLEAQDIQCRQMQADISQGREEMHQCEDRMRLAGAELISLLDTDMEEVDQKLEKAREDRQEVQTQREHWEERIEAFREKIKDCEYRQKQLRNDLDLSGDQLLAEKEELEDIQDSLTWEKHKVAMDILAQEQEDALVTVDAELRAFEKLILEGKQLIEKYMALQAEYDQAASLLDALRQEKIAVEQAEQAAQEAIAQSQDQLIADVYQMKAHEVWKPSDEILAQVEQLILAYQGASDESQIHKILRSDYETVRMRLKDMKNAREAELSAMEEALAVKQAQIESLRQSEDVEPERKEATVHFRQALLDRGVEYMPFYKAVEFAPQLSMEACARLEAQLDQAGLLDALVVSDKDFQRVKTDFPEMVDCLIHVDCQGGSHFDKLVADEALSEDLRQAVVRVLSNIYEKDVSGGGLYLGQNGDFHQGVLMGRASKSGEAEFVGSLARQRKKEQLLQALQAELEEIQQKLVQVRAEVDALRLQEVRLEEEYGHIPDFSEINGQLDALKNCRLELEHVDRRFREQEKKTELCAGRQNEGYQKMLKTCRQLPFGRTLNAYEEALENVEEYERIWQRAGVLLRKIVRYRSELIIEKDRMEDFESQSDEAFTQKRRCVNRVQELEIEINKYETYLNSPENLEKAKRRTALKQEKAQLQDRINDLDKKLAVLQDRVAEIQKNEASQKAALRELIREETCVRKYFEEELALKLVVDRGSSSLMDCAQKAMGMLRESDKDREPEDLLRSLYQVYQQHNSNLASYGTSVEDCFEQVDEGVRATRKRVRLVSVWNGKKLYLEEFYQTLKNAIEETELLIQEKDRELFEDILSQTISQQLTDRIAESRAWVRDMSGLMKNMETSMGLSFSLDWRPRSAEGEDELDTQELEHILLRDRELLTVEDIERVAGHFRSKIKTEKRKLEEDGVAVNYMDLVRDALDYRKWFAFQMSYYRNQEGKKPLTNGAFNRFSGGEKAMAMYVPLFAAVNAQYKKAEKKDHPRMIALDEAFAGVDDKNISSMFELVEKLGFDYIMNSQALWGCYETVKGLRIAELLRPLNSQVITVIYYTWNGHERILDEQ